MWTSHIKFEHAQQQQQHQQQPAQSMPAAVPHEINDFSNPSFHQMQAQAMPATPTHHRRGQSLTVNDAPRTPNTGRPSLRPPVFLQSPMGNHTPGLMGVGDVFNPPSGGFHENMGMWTH